MAFYLWYVLRKANIIMFMVSDSLKITTCLVFFCFITYILVWFC